jgi:subtilase family serine protease
MAAARPTAFRPPGRAPFRPALLACAAALSLAACGGGGDAELAADPATVAPLGVAVEAVPLFHRQPVVLAEPGDDDADGSARSALAAPQPVDVPLELRALSTQGLTDDRVAAWSDAIGTGRARAFGTVPATAAPVPVVHTPAQIRAAYGLPAVPASTAGLSAAERAALGAGQTVVIVSAYHHPNAVTDLSIFSQRFGLPGCSAVAVPTAATAATAARPLPAAPADTCQVIVLYSAPNGGIAAEPPAYSAAWATETALDMQWAHAMAPLARIVLIEAADSGSGLLDAIALANKLGPAVVSMSFGGAENTSLLNTAPLFAGAGMSYVAATGDSGSAANWPAVMPGVLAVGGTSLQWAAGSGRSETAWALGGGGLSSVVPLPAYQGALSVPGQSSLAGARRYRAVADVAFNADPATGQYFVMTAAGGFTHWYAGGGTSMAAPQWAGLLAVANAQRALKALPPLGQPHGRLYGNFIPGSAAWAQGFADITEGANGNCISCKAIAGYDTPTGLGSPRAAALLRALAAD